MLRLNKKRSCLQRGNSLVSITAFSPNKSNIYEVLTKYDSDLQEFHHRKYRKERKNLARQDLAKITVAFVC